MADNEARLRIVLDAINNAGDELKALQDDLKKTGQESKNAKGGFGELAGKFEELTGVSVPTAVTLGGVGAAVGAVYSIVSDSVGRFGEYAEQVRNLGYAYSLSSEQASELIQVLGDARVEPAALETAFRSMSDKGIQPTVDNLAKLADQFVNIHDPIAQAEFLAETFGSRAGPEMAKALGLGGYALRQYAEDAREAGLLLSDADLAAAERLKAAQDALGDAQIQFDKTVGLSGTQAYTELLDVAGDAWGQVGEWVAALFPAQMSQYEWVQETGRAYAEMTDEADRELRRLGGTHYEVADAAAAQADAAAALKDQYSKLQDMLGGRLGKENDRHEQAMGDLTTRARELRQQLIDLNQTHGQHYTYVRNSEISSTELALAQLQLAEAQGKLSEETDPEKQLQLQIRVEKLSETVTGATEVVDGYIDNSKEISELRTEYDEVRDAVLEEQLAHQKATRQIVFDILMRKAAEDGYKTITLEYLATVGQQWGLLDQDTATALSNIDAALEESKGNARAFVTFMDTEINGKVWYNRVETLYVNRYSGGTQVGSEDFEGWTPDPESPAPPPVSAPVDDGNNGTVDRNIEGAQDMGPATSGSAPVINLTVLVLNEADKERLAYDLLGVISRHA